jgi:hypothetical protein
VPPVLPTHHNIPPPLLNRSLANDDVASPVPFSHHVPREFCHNSPQDATAMLTMDTGIKTPSPTANASSLQVAAPSTTLSHCSWSTFIAKDSEIQGLNIQLYVKGNRIERLETYIGELKKKVHNEQNHKAKFKAHLDRFMGVDPSVDNQPKVPVNHKEEFENDLRECLKGKHKRLALSKKESTFGKVLQDKGFMNRMLFK